MRRSEWSGSLDSPAMRWFVDAFTSGGHLSLNLVGRGAAFLLRGLAKFTGAEFLDHLAAFVTDLNDLFGGFRERAREIAAALRSPEVAFVIVTSPSPLAIDEALFFHERLRGSQMATDAFVLNGVHPMFADPTATTKELETDAAAALPASADVTKAVRRMRRALDDARITAAADRKQADRLRARVGGGSIYVEVPALDEDVHDLGALAVVARHLTAPRAAA